MPRIALFACVAMLVLAGCQQSTAEPTTHPEPVPTATPAETGSDAGAAAEPQDATADQKPDEAEEANFAQGPMKLDILGMREMRLRVIKDMELPPGMRSDLQMRVRLQGEDLLRIRRFGNIILDKIVDDTGRSLIDDQTYTKEDRTTLHSLARIPPEHLRTNGLLLGTRCNEAAREAKVIKEIQGTIRLILADEAEDLTIINPLQYLGKTIDEPRLVERDVEVHIVPPDQFDPPAENCIALHFAEHGEYVEGASFVDAWMKPLPYRERRLTTTDGRECRAYCFRDAENFNNELQLVLKVYPNVKDTQVSLEARNVELP